MLLLDAASKLQLTAGTAGSLDYVVSKIRHADPQTPIVTKGNIADTTPTDIAAVPGGSEVDTIQGIVVNNIHATVSTSVTVEHVGGSTRRVFKCTLAPGEYLIWDDTGKLFVYDANGAVKSASTQNYDPRLWVKQLSGDESNSTTTLTEVAGLTLVLQPGTYRFEYYIRYQSAATGTGVRFSVNFDGTVTAFVANRRGVDISPTAATAVPDQDSVVATGTVFFAFSARAKSTAGWGTTLSVDTAAADMFEIVEGTMIVTVAGNLELWHGSEVAAQSTVKAGTMLTVVKANT